MIRLVTLILTLAHILSVSGEPTCTANAGVYSFKLGVWNATVIDDGILEEAVLGFVQPASVVRRNWQFYYPGTFPFAPQNVLLLKGKKEIVLIDTGAGNHPLFPGTGLLKSRLALAGVKPEEVTRIILTHGHTDHVGGLVNENEMTNYPNAIVYINHVEHEFWTSPADEIRPDFEITDPAFLELVINVTSTGYNRMARTYGRRLRLVTPGKPFLPGFEMFNSPGHTPGHTSIRVKSGQDSLVFVGDMVLSRVRLALLSY